MDLIKIGENSRTRNKVSMNYHEDANFQTYIELVKEQKMTWNTFEIVLKDVSYSSIDRLKYLNAILLKELTTNFSDIDRSRYLNSILLTEFKEFIYREDQFQSTGNEYFVEESEKSILDSDCNEERIKEDTEVKVVEIMDNKYLDAFSKDDDRREPRLCGDQGGPQECP